MAGIKQLNAQFQAADDAWGAALTRIFGKDACNQRYLPAGKGEPGTELYALHQAREAARLAWEKAINARRIYQ